VKSIPPRSPPLIGSGKWIRSPPREARPRSRRKLERTRFAPKRGRRNHEGLYDVQQEAVRG
jgi:hypothetical protein